MQVYSFHPQRSPQNGSVVTIGSFDGVHLGHQALIRHVVSQAQRRLFSSDLVTFDPHPQTVLRGHRMPVLTCLEARLRLFRGLGLDRVALIPFTRDLAAMAPEAFVREYLLTRFHVRKVVIGYDFAFGHSRQGSAAIMAGMGRQYGFEVEVFPQVKLGDSEISSTRIRQALAGADFDAAQAMLGRPFSVLAPVVRGDGRGRELGVPTLNQVPLEPLALATGVYAGRGILDGKSYPAVLNYGVRPTVGGRHRVLETHLFGFEGDGVGRWAEITPLLKLREEQKFPSLEALKAQILTDMERAMEWLNNRPSPPPDSPA
ncbi:MAG: bifunctional riboflavin kinase/FAD synthetase [Deltaproteobacteria bacterium]|nr:bifunctional riboflavin kinase/FAD synthetase [Deltaproteobacteria bacterium]